MEFMLRLRSFRRRELLRRGTVALLRTLPFAPAAALTVMALLRFGVSVLIVAAAVAAAAVGFAAAYLRRVPWSFRSCAKIADAGTFGRLSVTNALEVCRNGAAGGFADHTVELGACALASAFPVRRRMPLRNFRIALTAMLAALALFAVSGRSAHTDHAGMGDEALKAAPPDAMRIALRRELDASTTSDHGERHDAETSRNLVPSSGDPTGQGGGNDGVSPLANGAPGNVACGADSGTSRAEAAGAKQAGAPAEEFHPRRLRAEGGKGGANGDADESDDTDGINESAAFGARALKTSKRGRRSAKNSRRDAEERQTGFKLPGFDRNPPAGRDAAERDEHGDRPGEGRGGETGTKKARGTGTALPVIPLPDSVSGRPGNGHDALTPFRTAAGNSRDKGAGAADKASICDTVPEPPTFHPGFTALQRRKFMQNHQSTVK